MIRPLQEDINCLAVGTPADHGTSRNALIESFFWAQNSTLIASAAHPALELEIAL
jgi:hypothetical protein